MNNDQREIRRKPRGSNTRSRTARLSESPCRYFGIGPFEFLPMAKLPTRLQGEAGATLINAGPVPRSHRVRTRHRKRSW